MSAARKSSNTKPSGTTSEPSSPWKIRFSPRLLSEDYDEVGHAAFRIAQASIAKKLKVSPAEYGAMLHTPLHGLYKLKTSHVRIVYHIEAAKHEVWVLMIGGRRDIWDDEQPEVLARLFSERDEQRKRDEKTVALPPSKRRR